MDHRKALTTATRRVYFAAWLSVGLWGGEYMRLQLAIHPVSALAFGSGTRLDGSELTVDKDDLTKHLLSDSRLRSVDLEIVRPGENARVGWVYDIVEPRAKESGAGSDFPGILGPQVPVGSGTTHVLRGAAVTAVDEVGGVTGGFIKGAATKVLEMSGAPAASSPYTGLHHLVVVPHAAADLERHAGLNALRRAYLSAAVYLAKAAVDQRPATTETFDLETPIAADRDSLPRVAYIAQVHGHQHGTWIDEQIFYGSNTVGMAPVPLHPNEWLDGALVVSYSWGAGGVETYFYQNHPIILEYLRRHAAGEINFVGTIAMTAASLEEERARNCMMAANMAKWDLAADGAVVTRYIGGAPHADMFETARLCEGLGVRTVVMVGDTAVDRRVESAVLMHIPEVNAIVCSGSAQEIRWKVPAAEHVVAGDAALATTLGAPQELSAGQIAGVTNQQGASHLASIVY